MAAVNKIHARICKISVFLIFIAIYTYGAAPSVLGGDTGELQTIAHTGGIAHPTGYPLLVFLLRVWSLIPFEDPGFTATSFSIFCGALSTLLLYVIVEHHTKSIAAALNASVAFGTVAVFWHYALRAEVYTLFIVLVTSNFLLLTRFLETKSKTYFALFVISIGLSCAHHAMVILFLIPAIPFLSTIFKPLAYRTLFIWIAAGILCPIILYCCQFLAYDTPANPMNYLVHIGSQTSGHSMIKRILWIGMGKQYQGAIHITSATVMLQDLVRFTIYFTRQFSPICLMVAFFGLLNLVRHQHQSLIYIFLVVILTAIFASIYLPDQMETWSLSAYLIVAYLVGLGFAHLHKMVSTQMYPTAAACLLSLIVIASSFGWYGVKTRIESHPSFPFFKVSDVPAQHIFPNLTTDKTWDVFMQTCLHTLPDTPTLILANWNTLTPLKFMKHVEEKLQKSEILYRPLDPPENVLPNILYDIQQGMAIYATYYPEQFLKLDARLKVLEIKQSANWSLYRIKIDGQIP